MNIAWGLLITRLGKNDTMCHTASPTSPMCGTWLTLMLTLGSLPSVGGEGSDSSCRPTSLDKNFMKRHSNSLTGSAACDGEQCRDQLDT